MAKILTKAGITTGNTVEAFHVTQSIDAFTGIDAYDISLSGSLDVVGLTDITGDTTITGSLTINQTSISSSTESPIIEVKVDDANSYFRINNATNTDGFFTPTITTKQSDSPDRISLFFDALVEDAQDSPSATADVMRFRARRDSDFIQNRELFSWYNYTTRLMDMDKNGNLNIVASVTASSYTGSFVGDGSGITGIVSSSYAFNSTTASYALNSPAGTDTNFANTNLTFDGNREHDTNGNSFTFTSDGGGFGESLIFFDSTEFDAGWGLNYGIWDTNGTRLFHGGNERFGIKSTETVINEPGSNVDLRVESDTNPNMLFVDGGTNRVGIGKSAPNAILDVNGNTIITGSLTVSGSGNTSLISTNGDINLDAGGSQVYFKQNNSNRLTFNLDSTPSISSTGDFTLASTSDITLDTAALPVKIQAGNVFNNALQIGPSTTYSASIYMNTFSNGSNINLRSYTPNDSLFSLSNFGNYADININATNASALTPNFYIRALTGSASDLGSIFMGGQNTNSSFRFYMDDRTDIESQAGGGLDILGNLKVGANAYKVGGGSWTATSDSRLKENIITASIDTCYDGIKNLPLKYFRWKEEVSQYPQYDEHQLGWLAQDVEAVFPHAVQESDFLTWSTYTGSVAISGSAPNTILQPGKRYQDVLAGSELIENRKTLDADQITKMMYGAIQKLQQKVEALETQISGSI